MDVEFAAYGERNGAHALKGSTFRDPVIEKAVQITDLAWGLPDHLGSFPMYRARSIDKFYVLTKTVRDTTASRSGMAATIAAFFPLDKIVHESNFKMLTELLPDPTLVPAKLRTQQIACSSPPPTIAKPLHSNALIRALLLSDEKPVVLAGMEHFIDVVAEVWSLIPAGMRRGFGFAFVCDPSVSNNEGYTVLYCPSELTSRWIDQLVRTGSEPISPFKSTGESYFLDHSVRSKIDKLVDDLGVTVTCFSDLRKACLCHDTFQNLTSASNLEVTKLWRTIGILSPDATRGNKVKIEVLNEIFTRLRSGSIDTMRLVRNIDFSDFKASYNIETACRDGILRSLEEGSQSIAPVAELVSQAIVHANKEWASGVLTGVSAFVRSENAGIADRIWELLAEKPQLTAEDEMLIPIYPGFDSRMAIAAPHDIAQPLADQIIKLAIKRGFPELHAVGLTAGYPLNSVVEQLSTTWDGQDRLLSFKRLKERVSPEGLLPIVEQIDSDELATVAAECCIENPNMFRSHFKTGSSAWRKVISKIIELSPASLDTIAGIGIEIERSLELLLTDQLELDFQINVSHTKYANILDIPNRAAFWPKIDPAAYPGFLRSTAGAWITSVHEGESPPCSIESQLLAAILHRDMRHLLLPDEGLRALNRVINVFDILNELDESDFSEWRPSFLTKNRELSNVDAILLGRLVHDREWEDVASTLADDVISYDRSDLRPAVIQFTNLLHWTQRWRFGAVEVRVTPNEWWDELEATLIGLYSDGPRLSRVWERADGNPADLLSGGNATSQWRDCLESVRNGFQSGGLTIESLLDTAVSDYSRNTHLQMLKETRIK